jgi:hypothetical protein
MKSFERTGGFIQKSWINNLVSSPSFAKDLTVIYADDILQAVNEDKEFPTIEAAITDLRSRIGISDADANEIRKVATIKMDPKLYVAMDNISKFDKVKLAALISAYTTKCDQCEKAPCECSATLDTTVKKAVEEIGIERLAAMHDECSEDRAEDKAEHKEVVEDLEEVEEKVKKHEKDEAEREAGSACQIKTAGGLPEHLKQYQFKKKEEKKEVSETDKTEEKKEDDMEKAASMQKEAKTPPSISEELANKIKKEYPGDLEAAYATMWKIHNEGHGDKSGKKSEGATKMALDKKANAKKWLDYFKKQSWFQGSDEKVDKIVSNNPEELGYPGEVKYDRKPMETQVGGDSRDWEQKWFEGAADKTQKVMGPSGEELAEKKRWQRAKWDAYFKKTSSQK